MRRDHVMRILEGAVEASSPVMVHFGYDPDNIIVISGPKEPIVKVEFYPPESDTPFPDLIVATTKSNMRFFIDPIDVKLIQVADVTDPRFVREPVQTGVYN